MKTVISSKRAYKFPHPDPDSKETFSVPRHYVGEIPEWVKETELYKLARTGSNPPITIVADVTAAAGVSPEEAALRDKAKALKIPGYKKMSLADLVAAVAEAEARKDEDAAAGAPPEK